MARIPFGSPTTFWPSYGTGASWRSPHDERDFEFARPFKLPIVQVVGRPLNEKESAMERRFPVTADRQLRGYDGLATAEFKQQITPLAIERVGRAAVNYKLRDWLFSRQRFWGEPFPIFTSWTRKGQPTG